jgi:pyridinium-3,5-biscarboxylic acid mononucleotide sulfurtransferase
MMIKDRAIKKKEQLIHHLAGLERLLVAFSGGVDSSLLLAVSHEILGEKVIAVTASSIVHPSIELEDAKKFTHDRGIEHLIIQTNELNLTDFVNNSPERCYFCKISLLQGFRKIALEKGISYVAHAANADDLKDHRPGLKAAEELGVIAPLIEAQLSKDEIRFLSREMGLATWDKPSMACLASRIPYGDPITEKKLRMVAECEAVLVALGFKQFRVRHHGTVARIEVEISQLKKLFDLRIREEIIKKFREIGFNHVTVDLEGYISGSLNRDLADKQGT